ncbi:MAG: M56 family metallopeptidase [Planctomycetota bacterium]
MTWSWLDWVVENTVVGVALAAAVWLCCTRLRPRAATCHAMWLGVALKLVLPPLLLWSWLLPAGSNVGATGIDRTELTADTSDEGAAAVLADLDGGLGTAAGASPEGPGRTVAERPIAWWLLLMWGSGAAALIVRWVYHGRRFYSVTARGTPPPAWLLRDARAVAQRLGVRPPPLRVVAGLAAPCAGGFGRPRVFWPQRLLHQLDRRRARAMLGHELAHLRRGDHLVARFELVVTLLWWWHPLWWFVRAQLHEHAEQACDAWALEVGTVRPREYAETLLDLHSAAPIAPATVGAFRPGRAALQRRLVRVMRGDREWRVTGPAMATLAAAAILGAPSWSCEQAPWQRAWSALRSGAAPVPTTPAPTIGATTTPAARVVEPAVDSVAPADPVVPGPTATDPSRVKIRRVLAEMIRWRGRRAPAHRVADDLVAAVEELGTQRGDAMASLRVLSQRPDPGVRPIATLALEALERRGPTR